MNPKYNRVLLKLSGEALEGKGEILDAEKVKNVCAVIKKCADEGVSFGIVIGGGNIWRGRQGLSVERTKSDGMGMLATLINSIAISDALIKQGLDAKVLSALDVQKLAESFSAEKARSYLDQGKAVVFACGTGNPYFSTDTGAILRALEIKADIILSAKNIDAVYDSDPKLNPNAKRYTNITYSDIISKELGVVDFSACCMGKENGMKMLVFGLNDPENIYRAVMGDDLGTVVE